MFCTRFGHRKHKGERERECSAQSPSLIGQRGRDDLRRKVFGSRASMTGRESVLLEKETRGRSFNGPTVRQQICIRKKP